MIPHPSNITLHTGVFRIAPVITFNADILANSAATLLTERLDAIATLRKHQSAAQIQWNTSSLPEHAYRITISTSKILLEASSETGFFSASATLFLLFFSHSADRSIPCQTITDSPKYSWRGCHFDCSRHFFPLRFLKKLIDMCSIFKINVFHLHFCDDQGWRIELPDFPQLTQVGAWRTDGDRIHGGYYTEQDIRSLIAYAATRGITVVPECEMPGHCAAALVAYPELASKKAYSQVPSHWGILEDAYNISEPKVRTVLKEILKNLMELFPGRYFHIGGDEVPSESLIGSTGSFPNVQSLLDDFFKDICDFLISHNKIPIAWDEAIAHTPPKGTVGMIWQSQEYAQAAINAGYSIILCPQDAGCYLDHGYAKGPTHMGRIGTCSIEETMRLTFPELDETMVLGAQAAIWTEGMCAEWEVEHLVFPRLIVLAHRFWSSNILEKKDLPLAHDICNSYEVPYSHI